MLQKIRDNTQGIFAKIIVGLLILVFGLWGVEYLVGSFVNAPAAITINGVEIDEFQIEQEAQRRTQQMLAELGPDADPAQLDPALMRELAINDLIQQQLLVQAAAEAGMTVSPAAIDRQIASIPEFQVDGVFNNELAAAVLRSGGFTPNSFRAALRRDTVLNQMMQAYAGSGFVTPAEVERLAALSEQTREFRYLLVNRQDQANQIEIGDAAIEEYYQENSQEFMREEQVAIEYLVLDKADIFPEVEVTDAQIEAQYEEERATFESDVERRASHILLEAGTQDEIDAALEQAAELKARIDAGESFEDLAMEFSDDTGSAAQGGDVGYTTGDSFVEPFEEALRGLAVDEVSEPVVTEFGVHLIKLTEQSEEQFESLEEARDRIVRELRQNEVDQIYSQRAERLSNLAFESLDLQDPAELMGLEVQTTDLFGRSGGTGIAANPAVIDAAFSPEVLEDRLNSELVRVDDNRSVVVHLAEHRPAEVMELAEVRGEIENILRDRRVREMAEETGRSIVQSLQSGGNIDGILADQGLTWMSGTAARDSQQYNPELLQQLFGMEKPGEEGTTVAGFPLQTGEYAVVELQEVTPGTVDDLEETERQSLIGFVSQQAGAEAFEAFMTNLQENAEIDRDL